jgi:hypothetical protein
MPDIFTPLNPPAATTLTGVEVVAIMQGGNPAQTTIAAIAATAPDGDVVGPASAVDDRIATFDGTTGKLIQDGGSTIAGITALIPYAASDTYSPTLVPSAGTATPVGLTGAGALGYSRVGSGVGVVSAGDTVVMSGAAAFASNTATGTIDVPLPFEAADAPHPTPRVVGVVGTAAVASAAMTSATNMRITFASGGDDDGTVIFEVAYQTENAAD